MRKSRLNGLSGLVLPFLLCCAVRRALTRCPCCHAGGAFGLREPDLRGIGFTRAGFTRNRVYASRACLMQTAANSACLPDSGMSAADLRLKLSLSVFSVPASGVSAAGVSAFSVPAFSMSTAGRARTERRARLRRMRKRTRCRRRVRTCPE